MGTAATERAIQAAERRFQREAKRRQKELERQAKEMAKLSELEQARIEVETYENRLEVLLSLHKDQSNPWDWPTIAASLPPVPPRRQSHNELKARQRMVVFPSEQAAAAVQKAQNKDEEEYQAALQAHAAEHAECVNTSNLARRIIQGDWEAYLEAIRKLNPFAELAGIGSSLQFTVHNATILECVLSTKGHQAIPSEIKILTASGKVTVKPMPRSRFNEIYQDYVCGCVLRVARELFALLPIDTILVTSMVESIDTTTGHNVERPFLSVVILRDVLSKLNFDNIDPSDTIMSFTHRGDLKASRKTGEFEFINPLTVSDLAKETIKRPDFHALLGTVKNLRAEMEKQIFALNPKSEDTISTNGENK